MKILDRKSYISLIILVIMVAAYAYFSTNRESSHQISQGDSISHSPNLKGVSSELLQASNNQELGSSHIQIDGAKEDSPNKVEWLNNAAQLEEFNRWRAGRGWAEFLSDQKSSDYKGYSKDTLRRLGENGDVYALQTLASLANSPDESQKLFKEASVYGSTYALVVMGAQHVAFQGIQRESPIDLKRPALVEGIAYTLVAQIRGDTLSGDEHRKYMLMNYNFSPSEDDLRQALKRAEEIYSELESQREKLGLGKFDNSIPPIAEAFYRHKKLIK